jgi:hypothetical protein
VSRHSGAPAIRFHTHPLTEREADRLHEELGTLVPIHDVLLAVGDVACLGVIAPMDTAAAALEALMGRLRADPRILPLTVHVSRFP